MKSNRRLITMFPELVESSGEPWQVKLGFHVHTDHKKHEIELDSNKGDLECQKVHELLHVWATPKNAKNVHPGVDRDLLQVCEDYRIEQLGLMRGVQNPVTVESIDKLPHDGDLRLAVELHMISRAWPDDAQAALRDQILAFDVFEDKKKIELFQSITNRACTMFYTGGRRLTFSKTIKAARFLTEVLKEFDEEGKPNLDIATQSGSKLWGDMTIVDLTKSGRSLAGQRHFAARDTGENPSYPWRQMIDGRPFRTVVNRKRGRGGSVLLDASGSMGDNATAPYLRLMLRLAPAADIAAYAGNDNAEGRLFIMAKQGKAAKDDDLHPETWGGENVVDFPALKWLAQQPAPRVWVSDGAVRGRDYKRDPFLYDMCHYFCKEHGIVMARSVYLGLRQMGLPESRIKAEFERMKS